MLEQGFRLAAAWWRARSERERTLMRVAAIAFFGLLVPLASFQAAWTYRAAGASALAEARQIEADVALIASAPQIETDVGDGTLRSGVIALAQANSLTVGQVTPLGSDRLRVTFAAADSLLVYRWMDATSRRGWNLARSELVRVDEGNLVEAEFEVSVTP